MFGGLLAHSFATIANFQWFSMLPSPLNGMVEGNHWDQWFSDWFRPPPPPLFGTKYQTWREKNWWFPLRGVGSGDAFASNDETSQRKTSRGGSSDKAKLPTHSTPLNHFQIMSFLLWHSSLYSAHCPLNNLAKPSRKSGLCEGKNKPFRSYIYIYIYILVLYRVPFLTVTP